MTANKHFILPAALIGAAAAASVFAFYIAARLRPACTTEQKPALACWEDEGGRVAETVASTP